MNMGRMKVAAILTLIVASAFAIGFYQVNAQTVQEKNDCIDKQIQNTNIGLGWIEKARPGSITGLSDEAKEIAGNGLMLSISQRCGVR